MPKWCERTALILLVLSVLLYLAAKVHFYTRFGGYLEAGNLKGYILEHWPFWAAMGVIAVLLLLLRAIGKGKVD
jgi:hypothetical protein